MHSQALTLGRAFASSSSHPLHRDMHDRQKPRALVIDDSSDGRWMISSILNCLGLEVQTAATGRLGCEAALSAAKSGRAFDIVLMDWQMPEMDGGQATAALRSAGYTGLIVALVSPSSFGHVETGWQRVGCDGAASKPITFEMLRGVVRQHLPARADGQQGGPRLARAVERPVLQPLRNGRAKSLCSDAPAKTVRRTRHAASARKAIAG
jgi:CheY-like chemotaxis protein